MISQTDPEREIYEARLRARREAASQWRTARAEGRAEGREEGRAEGRAEGRSELLRQLIQPLQKALGREATPSEKLRSLSTEELENAWAELQAELPKSQ